MTLTKIGDGISGLVGAGIIFIGARFLLAPRAAAAGYGISTEQDGEPTDPYFAAKGVRDIASGIAVFVLLAAGTPRILGGYMAAGSIIPIGTASTCYGTTARRQPPTACTARRPQSC